MGQSDYQRLGDYIQLVDVRNKELKVEYLLGVSNTKEFIPSIANTIGTDMSNYKIVTKGQFVYGAVTSRNGDKLSIALMEEEEAIVSQAYTVFEVVDKRQLLPDYLMMWFRRPEFDRYARFKSHGSAREVFDWEEMCEVCLPIPDIEVQREIVAQYETITHRIALNKRICTNLEETAQALYNKMFVQDIDPENLLPGWRMETIGNFCDIFTGKKNVNEANGDGKYAFFSCSPMKYRSNDYIFDGEAILIAGNGSYTGRVSYYNGKFDLYQRTYACTLKKGVPKEYTLFLLSCLKFGFEKKYLGGSRGSSIPYIVRGDISNYKFPFSKEKIHEFFGYARALIDKLLVAEAYNELLVKFQILLINRLSI